MVGRRRNVGTVYHGTNGFEANTEMGRYKGLSKHRQGRAAGEPVTLFRDGEIIREYEPP